MKLLSFTASGRDLFGAVSGDGVVTLNDKLGQPDLAAALGACGLEALRQPRGRRPTTSSPTSNSVR